MSVTAITICNQPCKFDLEGIHHLCDSGHQLNCAKDVCNAWLSSINQVETEWFFWLDSDDELNHNYSDVIHECIQAAQHLDLAYTDELLIQDNQRYLRHKAPYNRNLHLHRPDLLHHLVLVRTSAARRILDQLPVGHYWPEMLLYWSLGRRGAAYVPRVGYHWHKSTNGLSSKWWTGYSISQSQLWCKANP